MVDESGSCTRWREPKIKEAKFRLQNRGVNESYDMVRVIIDMPYIDWSRKRMEVVGILWPKDIVNL